MDNKTLTAVATSLALMQLQVNALLLLLERHTPGASIKEDFQQLIREGVRSGWRLWRGLKADFTREFSVTAITEVINIYHSFFDGRMIAAFSLISLDERL
jgi:hypothetical protein